MAHRCTRSGDNVHMPEIILASLPHDADPEGTTVASDYVSHRDVQSNSAAIGTAKDSGDTAVLVELRKTRKASCFARALVAYPWAALVLSLLCLAALSVVPFLRPPKVNVSFETLTVQTHAVNRAAAAADYLATESDLYWSPSDASVRRSLQALPVAFSEGTFVQDEVGLEQRPDRQLLQSSAYRSHVEWTLDVVYYQSTKATMLDPSVLEKIKAVEDRVYGLDRYERLCIHHGSSSVRRCRRPISFANYVYGELQSDGSFAPNGAAAQPQNVTLMAQVLAVRGMTYFFDKDANFETGYTSTLRSAFVFGAPADGVDGFAASEDVYRKLCKDMHDILKDASDGTFQITFGGEVMTDWEIEQQLFQDARFVSLAIAIAVVMLLIGTRSVVLTIFALLQILVSFPIAYTFYYAFGYSSIGLIQLLAPFVILGIGLDDVFVFTSVYRSMQAYAADFAIETRLTAAWKRSFGAILATSATSTIAFAANIISPLPAIRMFGYLLAILAAVNFLLVTTFAPVYVILNERFCSCCACFSAHSPEYRPRRGSKLALTTAASKGGLTPQPVWNGERLDTPLESADASTEGEDVEAPVAAPGRRIWGAIFEAVWRGRAVFVLVLLGVAVWGAYNASQLEPADSAPALFDKDHNVQRYLNMVQANYTDSSIFSSACSGCFNAELALSETDTIAVSTGSPASPTVAGSLPPSPDGSTGTPSDAVPTDDPATSLPNFTLPPPPPPAAFEPTPVDGFVPTDAPPPPPPFEAPSVDVPPDVSVPFVPADSPFTMPPPPPFGSSSFDGETEPPPPPSQGEPPTSDAPPPPPVTPVEISSDALAAAADRSNTNTIRVDVLWGVTGIIENKDRDPFDKEGLATGLKYDEEFDLSQASTQIAVLRQVEDLARLSDGSPQEGKEGQVGSMLWDVLGTLRQWCLDQARDRSYCSQLDSQSGLPTGSSFDSAVFAMLSESSLSVQGDGIAPASSGDARRSIGFEFSEGVSAETASSTPKVRWVRYAFASATSESASPADILDSYETWNDWASSISKEVPEAGKPLVAGEPWIIAVTEDLITRNTIWSIVLSSVCALISVYVFTGSARVTVIALVTMTCVNVFTLGLFHVMGWSLGATEGVAITVLVGLSVDYCLHFSEAFVLSVLSAPRARAKDSLMLMGTPVLSSALSTVLVSVPLALTETVALRKFAVVIAVSLGASYLYAVLMLLPLLGTAGPAKRPDDAPMNWAQKFLNSGLRRAALASGLFLALMVVLPAGRDLLFDNYGIAIILAAIICSAIVTSLWRWCRGTSRTQLET